MAGMSYVPALDGVRGLAVTAVLCFHGGWAWAGGGFLGVDAFFVLSGYLITTLLLSEWQRTGQIRLMAFWGRRARRLLPALVVMVAVVALTARALVPASELRLLRDDAWASLFYLNNWQMVAGGGDYFAVTASPSPFEHTWSLAIEEQFYLLWPLLLVLLFRWRRPRRRLLLVCVAGMMLSVVALAVLHDPRDPARVYYGTDTRAASLLIGSALAVALSHHTLVMAFGRSLLLRRSLGGLSFGASILVIWAWTHVDGGDGALYGGAMFALAAAVAVVLAHIALVPAGMTARLLSRQPLPSLGRISYGVYLWHWPIFLALTAARSGLTGWPLFLTRCLATLVIATLSYTLLERPIRSGAWLRRPSLAVPGASVAVAGCALLVAVVTTVPGAQDPQRALAVGGGGLGDLAAAVGDLTEADESDAAADEGRGRERSETVAAETSLHVHHRRPGRPVVVDVFGDSMATSLVEQLPPHPGLDIRDRTLVGCGITLKAPYRYFGHTYPTVWRVCRPWVRLWRLAIERDDPDVVLILVGRWETMDRVLDGRWTHVGEHDLDAHLRSRLRAAITIAGSHGAQVVLATQPYNRRGEQTDGSLFPEDHPVRVRQWNDLLRDVAAASQGVELAELGSRVTPGTGFTWTAGGFQMRTDGVHLAADGVRNWIAPWMFPRLLRWAPR